MEYKVVRLMNDNPKEWKGPHGVIYYHSVEVEGHDKPLSVGKKEANSIKVGDTIYGDITATDYIEDKFKASPRPEGATGSQSFDDRGDAITASMVVKIAFQAFMQAEGMLPQEDAHWRQIDYMAEQLKASIDKVKAGSPTPSAPTPETKVTKEKNSSSASEPLPLPPEDWND